MASDLADDAAALLPRLSLDDLEHCRSRRRSVPLSSCVNLAIAGTASTSLDAAFNAEPTLAARSMRISIANTDSRRKIFYTSSSHALTVRDLQRWFRKRQTRPTCFVLTVRDPADRMESAFRFAYAHHERLVSSLGLARVNRTAAAIVERLRNPFMHAREPLSLAGRTQNVSSTAFLYAHSAGEPDYRGRVTNYPGPVDGSQFLISQKHYMRGVNCTESELHFVCTERFDADFNRFLRSFGVEPNRTTYPRKEHRVGATAGPAFWGARKSHLSEEDRAFVRNVLYPWDTALHRWACGGAPAVA